MHDADCYLNLGFSFLICKMKTLQAIYCVFSWLNVFYEKCFTHPFFFPHFSISIWYTLTIRLFVLLCYATNFYVNPFESIIIFLVEAEYI